MNVRLLYASALPIVLASCATGRDRWNMVQNEGALTRWAACMESDGYNAWSDAGTSAAAALQEGATPITNRQIFRIGLAACEAFDAAALAALPSSARAQLYEEAERQFRRKLAEESGQI